MYPGVASAFFDTNPVSYEFNPRHLTSRDLFRRIPNLAGEKCAAATQVLFSRNDHMSLQFQFILLQRWCWQTIPSFDSNDLTSLVTCILNRLKNETMDLGYKLYGLYFCSKIYNFSLVCPRYITKSLEQLNSSTIKWENDDLLLLIKTIFNQSETVPDLLTMDSAPLENYLQNAILLAPKLSQKNAERVVDFCMKNYRCSSIDLQVLSTYIGHIGSFKADALLQFILRQLIPANSDYSVIIMGILDACIPFISPPVFDALINDQKMTIHKNSLNKVEFRRALEILRLCVLRTSQTQVLAIVTELLSAYENQDEENQTELFITLVAYLPLASDGDKDKILAITWSNLHNSSQFIRQVASGNLPSIAQNLPQSFILKILDQLFSSTEIYNAQALLVISHLIPFLTLNQNDKLNKKLLSAVSYFPQNVQPQLYYVLTQLALQISDNQVQEQITFIEMLHAKHQSTTLNAEVTDLLNCYKLRKQKTATFKFGGSGISAIYRLYNMLQASFEDKSLDQIAIMRALRRIVDMFDHDIANNLSITLLPLLSNKLTAVSNSALQLLAKMTMAGKIDENQFQQLLLQSNDQIQAELVTLSAIHLLHQEVINAMHTPKPSLMFSGKP